MLTPWSKWLAAYYPNFDRPAFELWVQRIQQRKRLPWEESLYIVLGCGYLFQVHKVAPEKVLAEWRRQSPRGMLYRLADFVPETVVKREVEGWGCVVGPQELRLAASPKSGTRPDPAPRIAVLTLDEWFRHFERNLEPANLLSSLYPTLSGRPMQEATVIRYRKAACRVPIMLYESEYSQEQKRDVPKQYETPVIGYVMELFRDRYQRSRDIAAVLQRHSPSDQDAGRILKRLYLMDPPTERVLRAVNVEVAPSPRSLGPENPRGVGGN